MKVIQLVPCISYGDATSNDILAIKRLLKKNGYDTEIYAETIDSRLNDSAVQFSNIPKLNADDILIYHMATASTLSEYVKEQKCIRIMRYHNITPQKFFIGYNSAVAEACYNGIQEVKRLNHSFDYCIPVSEFNASDLRDYGYECPMSIVPPLIPFNDYKGKMDNDIFKRYNDGKTNILFVGRFAPNKKWEDIIAAFSIYQKYWNQNSRLLMVGSYDKDNAYFKKLKKYTSQLGIKNAVFTGHIGFSGILACYKVSHLFLCLSEHEGFCVPLVEAMLFKKPVVAYSSCAVPSTMGPGTMVIKDKNPAEVAGMVNYVLTHEELREDMIRNQNELLKRFEPDVVEEQFLKALGNAQNIKSY